MKDPSSPMDVCPFCGKAFKRLKSHLPHCKMAKTKNTTPETDSGDKSMTASLVSGKRTGTVGQNQDQKVKETSKTEGVKSGVRQNKTTQGKVGKVTSGSRLTQQKAAVTTEHSQKDLQTTTRTSQMVTSAKERGDDKVALTKPNAPIQQALKLRPCLLAAEPAMVDSPAMSNTLQTVRDQANAENYEGDQAIMSAPQRVSEQGTEGSLIGVRAHEQVHLSQSSVPRSVSGSSNAGMVFGWSTSFPQERVKTQIPGTSPTACNIEAEIPHIKALGTIGKSLGTKMDMPSSPKIELLQPVDGPLGLQWVPQFYNNYVQLGVVPGRQDQWDPPGRGTKTPEPTGGRPEHCEAVCKKSVLENQSISKALMDVRLGELPAWLATRRYSPWRIPELIENAWGRYYNKYINVRKGGMGGLTMLLAGYCVLSYTWNYHHIKQDRWRKYH